MAEFWENYIEVPDKVVELLKAQAEVGSEKLLDGIVKPENIHRGSPIKANRDIYEGEWSLFCNTEGSELITNSTSSSS